MALLCARLLINFPVTEHYITDMEYVIIPGLDSRQMNVSCYWRYLVLRREILTFTSR